MRVLVLFAHPVETSFGAVLQAAAVEALRGRGHEVDDCDLNAEGFDPVMTRQDCLDYYDLAANRGRVAPCVDRLLGADAQSARDAAQAPISRLDPRARPLEVTTFAAKSLSVPLGRPRR
jgi:putative NADPH-quinone reductase